MFCEKNNKYNLRDGIEKEVCCITKVEKAARIVPMPSQKIL